MTPAVIRRREAVLAPARRRPVLNVRAEKRLRLSHGGVPFPFALAGERGKPPQPLAPGSRGANKSQRMKCRSQGQLYFPWGLERHQTPHASCCGRWWRSAEQGTEQGSLLSGTENSERRGGKTSHGAYCRRKKHTSREPPATGSFVVPER